MSLTKSSQAAGDSGTTVNGITAHVSSVASSGSCCPSLHAVKFSLLIVQQSRPLLAIRACKDGLIVRRHSAGEASRGPSLAEPKQQSSRLLPDIQPSTRWQAHGNKLQRRCCRSVPLF